MATWIYYFTGTGNSLWVSRELARRLDDEVRLISLGSEYCLPDSLCDRVGIVFPVHIWGLPRCVVDFVGKLEKQPSRYIFALAVNAGQVAATLLQMQKKLAVNEVELSAGFDVKMPSNYIPWRGAQPKPEQDALFLKARQKIDRIAERIQHREMGPIEKGPGWQNVAFTIVYNLTFSRVPKLGKYLRADFNCNGCGVCADICPASNIHMEAGRPVWEAHCEQCLACLQWCPQTAVQYANKTAGKERYHHPEVCLSDMKAAAQKNSNFSGGLPPDG